MKVLYITYDGLLDPLGASQILPYINGLSDSSKNFYILSFEKQDKMLKASDELRDRLLNSNIIWEPVLFSYRFGLFSKAWDLIKLFYYSYTISNKFDIDTIHARGHVATITGVIVKKLLSLNLIFDFRGLWVDERVDKGGWSLKSRVDRFQYNLFKKLEKFLLRNSDHIIVLTKKIVHELTKISGVERTSISTIPCCADFNHFTLKTPDSHQLAKASLGIPENAIVIGYLGSIGSMYCIKELFDLFSIASKYTLDLEVRLLIITNDYERGVCLMKEHISDDLHSKIIIRSANRDEVPTYIHAMSLMASFITPSYARQGASPTKIAESLACGVPIISNAGVGDISEQIKTLRCGYLIENLSKDNLHNIVLNLHDIISIGGSSLRNRIEPYLGLNFAIAKYKDAYSMLGEKSNV